jgi:hypothetical protein
MRNWCVLIEDVRIPHNYFRDSQGTRSLSGVWGGAPKKLSAVNDYGQRLRARFCRAKARGARPPPLPLRQWSECSGVPSVRPGQTLAPPGQARRRHAYRTMLRPKGNHESVDALFEGAGSEVSEFRLQAAVAKRRFSERASPRAPACEIDENLVSHLV